MVGMQKKSNIQIAFHFSDSLDTFFSVFLATLTGKLLQFPILKGKIFFGKNYFSSSFKF